MLLDDAHLPIPILTVLTEQSRERAAWAVPTANLRALPNFAASSINSQVVLVILVAREPLVEEPEPLERFLAPTTIGHRIDITFEINIVKPSASDRKRRVIDSRNGFFDVSCCFCPSRPAHVVGPRRFQSL